MYGQERGQQRAKFACDSATVSVYNVSRKKTLSGSMVSLWGPDGDFMRAGEWKMRERAKAVWTALSLTAALAGAALPVQAAPAVEPDGGVFDAKYYYENNQDVAANLPLDEAALYAHYELFGIAEGRTPCAYLDGFDPAYYAAQNPDVVAAVGTSPAKLYAHYLQFGRPEGRKANADDTSGKEEAVILSGENGTASQLEQTVQGILSSCTNDSMDTAAKLRAAYQWVIDHTSYKRSYETPSGDWTKGYALEALTTGQGNCYRYGAALAYLAKGLGLDAKVVTGQIQSARGGVTPHCWTVITVDGTEYICDSEMADAKNRADAFYMKTFADYPVKPLVAQQEWAIDF